MMLASAPIFGSKLQAPVGVQVCPSFTRHRTLENAVALDKALSSCMLLNLIVVQPSRYLDTVVPVKITGYWAI